MVHFQDKGSDGAGTSILVGPIGVVLPNRLADIFQRSQQAMKHLGTVLRLSSTVSWSATASSDQGKFLPLCLS